MIVEITSNFGMRAKTLLFDRDGTINVDSGYTSGMQTPKLTQEFESLITQFDRSKVEIGIVTNQSGVGRGFFTLDQLFEFNKNLLDLLEARDFNVSAILICPHHPDLLCHCRKPSPTMLQVASRILGNSQNDVIFIGNSESDRLAAQSAQIEYHDIRKEKLGNILMNWAST